MAKAVILGVEGGRNPFGAVALALATVALCAAAIFNDFALFWPDTENYILAHDNGFRSPFYGYLIHLLHWRWSLWPVVIAQSWMVAHLLWLVCRTVFHKMSRIGYVLMILALGAFSSLPWYTGFIMPDIFAPVLGLCVYLLAFHYPQLGKVERVYLWILLFLAALVHLSHVLLGLGCVGLVVLLGWESNRGVVRMALTRLLPPVLLAIVVLMGNTYLKTDTMALSAHGAPFLAARFIADGPGLWVLNEECPDRGWALCDVRHLMTTDSDQILWDLEGPMMMLGGIRVISGEASDLVALTVRRYPVELALDAVQNAVRQFSMVTTGHSLRPYMDEQYPTEAMAEVFPHRMPAYRASRQNTDRLWMNVIRPIHGRVIVGAAVLSGLLFMVFVVRKSWGRFRFLLFTAGLLMLNASIAGALSTPNHRYQSRVIWLLVFLAMAGWWSVLGDSLKRRRHARKGSTA